MRKRNNRKYYVVILLIVIASLSIGYAIFSEVLNITGSATTTGTFDIEFTSATVSNSSNAGTPTAIISADKNTLTLTADTLQLPSAYAEYSVVVTNVGNIASELIGVTPVGTSDTDITVSIVPAFTTGTIINPSGTYAFTITVTWDSASTKSNKTLDYSIQLDYQQAS